MRFDDINLLSLYYYNYHECEGKNISIGKVHITVLSIRGFKLHRNRSITPILCLGSSPKCMC